MGAAECGVQRPDSQAARGPWVTIPYRDHPQAQQVPHTDTAGLGKLPTVQPEGGRLRATRHALQQKPRHVLDPVYDLHPEALLKLPNASASPQMH